MSGGGIFLRKKKVIGRYMKIIRSVREMQDFDSQGSRGFVPTMGALHDGHLSLVRQAKEQNDCLITSVFVNPLQFLPGEDFAEYPRDEERDIELLRNLGVDVLFIPDFHQVYDKNMSIGFSFPDLVNCLCGKMRPGHFEGVALIVAKLFNLVRPHNTYFGQKDYQQAIIVKRLIEDLNFPVKLHISPTVREQNGLAMSSRNVYLKADERAMADNLYKILLTVKHLIEEGENSVEILKQRVEVLLTAHGFDVNYFDIRGADDLCAVQNLTGGTYLVALSVKLGSVHLIDNILVDV